MACPVTAPCVTAVPRWLLGGPPLPLPPLTGAPFRACQATHFRNCPPPHPHPPPPTLSIFWSTFVCNSTFPEFSFCLFFDVLHPSFELFEGDFLGGRRPLKTQIRSVSTPFHITYLLSVCGSATPEPGASVSEEPSLAPSAPRPEPRRRAPQGPG